MQDLIKETTIHYPTAKLFSALAKAQAQIKPAVKDQENPFHKSKYADLASVFNACREPLATNGLCVIQQAEGDNSEVRVTTILAHESGESMSSMISIKPAQATAQGMGSAITYARRYSLMAMVGIAPEDDDGEGASRGKDTKDNKDSIETNKSKDDNIQKAFEDFCNRAMIADKTQMLIDIWKQFQAVKNRYSEPEVKRLEEICRERKTILMKIQDSQGENNG